MQQIQEQETAIVNLKYIFTPNTAIVPDTTTVLPV
jgi:hypothetical protein